MKSKATMLFGAISKNQRGSILGIFILVLVSALCLFSALTMYASGVSTVEREMERLGFGDFTVWVSDQPESLEAEIDNLWDVGKVTFQPLIFSGYEIKGMYSDNEGQLIVYDGSVSYRFITENGIEQPVPEILPGTIYISPAMQSVFDVKVGDEIQFELSRSNGIKSFVVAGFFEDAFMGSSMIDMKSFLICSADHAEMQEVVAAATDVDVLARNGAMLHIFQSRDSQLPEKDFHSLIQSATAISLYTEFTYRKESILSYMLLLQNILSGFMAAFSLVLLVICFVVTGHSLSAVVEQDKRDMAVLKTMGLSGSWLRGLYLALYGSTVLSGLLLGLIFAFPITKMLAQGMISSTGMLIDIKFPIRWILPVLLILPVMFFCFLYAKTKRILAIAPMQTIRETSGGRKIRSALRKGSLSMDIALRELRSGRTKYVALWVISVFLTVFLSMIGRMGTWLGPNGEGLMNTFSVAGHDLGVQPFNESVPMDEIERVINWYSPVRETYELAMESVTVDGQEYTANVLNDTKWFHVLSGKVCDGNSILVTDTVADELGLDLGDTVKVAANGRVESYTVSGIYQCANGMGNNIGMSLEGYSKIGNITGFIWCYHYILANGAVRDYAMKYLQENYSGIDVHTNSWSGLSGIVFVMHTLIIAIYLVAAVFILISVALTSGKILQRETGNMAVYKSMGLSTGKLRLSFSMRFLVVVSLGAVAGMFCSAVFADTVIENMFKVFGIGEFHSGFSILGTILPLAVVPLLFFGCAWLFSDKIKQVSIVNLISENDE